MKVYSDDTALILVDIQYDFLEGGALEVANSNNILPLVNNFMPLFKNVFATRDYHPANHKSFASNNPGKNVGELSILNGVDQVMWPDHCVQGSRGSEISDKLDQSLIHKVFFKGQNPEIDSYSGFFENDHKTKTELDDYLKSKGIKRLFICGLATDYCVKFTVLDALKLGYETHLIEDAVRGVNINEDDSENALSEMLVSGAILVLSEELS